MRLHILACCALLAMPSVADAKTDSVDLSARPIVCSSASTQYIRLAQNRAPTYAPGGHAIIPAPAYQPPPVQYIPPPQVYTAPAPVYAPGGHAIIPTAPAYVAPPPQYRAPAPVYQATAPTYAPGGHAIIPSAPAYVAPPTQYRAPAPTYQATGPTYAPGGHAIVPTAPQANYAPNNGAASYPYNRTANFNQPSFSATGPTYASGGHAIIPSPQQAVPTFSPQFSISGRMPANAPPNQASGSRLTFSPAVSGNQGNTRQSSQPQSSQPNTAGFPANGRPTLNSFQGIGGQSTPATVGVIPPQTAGRLQISPLPSQSAGRSNNQQTESTRAGLPATIKNTATGVWNSSPEKKLLVDDLAGGTAARIGAAGYQKEIDRVQKSDTDYYSLLIRRRNEARATGVDTTHWDTLIKNFKPTTVQSTDQVFPALNIKPQRALVDAAGTAVDAAGFATGGGGGSAARTAGKALNGASSLARTAEVGRAIESPTRFIEGVTFTDIRTGRTFEGTVDLKPTLDRINSRERYPHRNDGGTFVNRPPIGATSPLLPEKPSGYYKEYVVPPPPGISGPGGQRLVVGKGGEMYYTPDHYGSFIPLNSH